MLEPIVVDTPTFWPQACAVTGDTTGPMVDTHRELPGYGRVYVSRRAAVMLARAFGLTRGKKHTELLNSAELLEAKQRELDEVTERALQLTDTNALLVAENGEQAETIAMQTQRIAQLEEAIRADAASRLAVVGD